MENIEIAYLTTGNASKLWVMPQEKIRKYCREEKVRGAFMEKGRWHIPRNAMPPVEDDVVYKILIYILLVNSSCLYEDCKLDIDPQELTQAINYMSDFGYIEYSTGDRLKDCQLTTQGKTYITKKFEKLSEKLSKLQAVKILQTFGNIVQVFGTIANLLTPLLTTI
ncbi:MAG TPA: hypothetical protein IAB47_11065 [Candidatus Scatomorpha merdigallinarum]|nr:hypothetical protein [Candidatus Scatomorpha merdigallinarum]